MMKIKVYTLRDAAASPKCIGTMKSEVGETLADLRLRLEQKQVLNFQFQYWNVEECCRVATTLESLNDVEDTVFMIPILEVEDEVEYIASKRQRLCNEPDLLETRQSNDLQMDAPDFPPIDMSNSRDTEIQTDLASCSRVSASSKECFLKSEIVPKEVMLMYSDGEQKLRKVLKDVSLEDHDWCLKSYDNHGKAVVIVYCLECKKDFGGTDGQHTKDRISNLFSNFRKSHIMSNQHIRSWCNQKRLDWCNHPQSLANGKKTVVLTSEDHKRLVLEGVEILNRVNDNLDSSWKTFELVGGDPNSTDLKSFWWKTKCVTCNEVYSLCPPKKNLEANLLNHAGGSRHAEKVLEATTLGRGVALSGKRGRPMKSIGDTASSNQKQLHAFFNHVGNSPQVSLSRSMDRFDCKMLMCWGFRGPSTMYAGKSFDVVGLLFDIKPGQCWYPEPWLQEVLVVDGHCINIMGTFRHRSCLRVSMNNEPWAGLTCSMCATIPCLKDFRFRVMREDKCVKKRGTRTTEGGRRIGYLSLPELTTHSRSMSTKLRAQRLYHWAAKLRIVQLKVKRPTLKESAVAASNEHNLYKFCSNILSAHRSGAFGGQPALWDFLRDVAANLNRRKEGSRYSENSKAFAQAMKVYGGRRMCDLFSLNYYGPSYSTVKRENKKGLQHVPGEHDEIFASIGEIYKDAKFAHGITGPVPVILAEDETKVRSRVSYEQRFDSLTGFCGPTENHVCVSNYKPIVGVGEAGYNKILECFQNDKVGGFARILMVSPLHEKLPRLVLCVSCTCNCFDSNWVHNQWVKIDKLWDKHCKGIVGPIIGHASDGDSRRRQLMLAEYKSTDGERLKIDWPGWVFTGKLDSAGNASGLHDQDFIHNRKKLINPIDSPVRTPQLGADVVTLSHLGLIYNKFSYDQHGLKLEDTNRKDRQNWASAQRICQKQTRQCLAELRISKEVHQERTLSTQYYLEVCSNYIDIFLSPRHDLRSRIVLASKVSFFFRIWKLWFQFGNHAVGGNSKKLTAATNFVSQQCFIDVQMSCHFVVLLICHFRDKYPDFPVPLHLTGSDACEIFFSKVGGMEGHERAYDFHELVSTANTLNRLTATEFKESGLKFGRVHNKMKNVWSDLHPLTADEVPCNLSNYSSILTDVDVISALQEGLEEAQTMLTVLNMAPIDECCDKSWFLTPWLLERADPQHFAYIPASSLVRGEDGDAEVLCHDLQGIAAREASVDSNSCPVADAEEDIVEDGSLDIIVLESEARDVVTELLNSEEPQMSCTIPAEKVIPFVEFEGHNLYKSTLVSQLNSNPFLSKDRLTRVKNSIYFNNSDDYISASSSTESMLLGLGMDCGVYFMQCSTTNASTTVKPGGKKNRGRPPKKSQPTCVLNRVDQGTWCIGRVQKMRRKVGTRWGNCRQPIDLQNRDVNRGKRAGNVGCTCMVYLNYFRRVPGFWKFKYDHSDSIWVDVDTIICTVTMSYDAERNFFELDHVDGNSLDEFVEKSK